MRVSQLSTGGGQSAQRLHTSGKYHDAQDPELRLRLQHCKLTNLVGEQCFGDLDFSMFKRRNASAHLHSPLNMLKRNKTLTDWFQTLSDDDQKAALSRAAAQRQILRDRHIEAEKEAIVKRRELLQQN